MREFLSLMEVTSILPVFLFNMGSAIVQMDSGGGDFEGYLTLFPVGNECFCFRQIHVQSKFGKNITQDVHFYLHFFSGPCKYCNIIAVGLVAMQNPQSS